MNEQLFIKSIRFLPSSFTSSLTLSSKCFATFPHGTCSLSVSRPYLALCGVYHTLWTAIPGNPTLQQTHTIICVKCYGTCTLFRHWAAFKQTYTRHTQPIVPPTRHMSFALRESVDSALGFFHFTRRYFGNRSYFLFLCLLICLSSASNHA